ncbi:hypothetical protein DSL72_001004 [Monilinia vaccinii-corymbosi]|uniref:Rhodopsin domain-containing protein n=1 Tax=Monilinia vaccinii-corymbosi TaxID=61207 RepID=A0A8A3P9V6_9HELO|nr:hypothetical protein DSL72_001004 [Monilinia vaccinii-corymbosi]
MSHADATVLPLEGFPLTIFVVSSVGLLLSMITVAGRAYCRLVENLFGWDDGLMVLGLIVFAVDVGLTCHGTRVGIGSFNSSLNVHLASEGSKYLVMWLIFYLIALAIIKSSICVTLLRIAGAHKVYRLFLWGLLAITICTFVATLTGVLLLCRPVSANWDGLLLEEGKGKCEGMDVIVALSYTSMVCTILTDTAFALFPGVMLYKSQMPLARKIQVGLLLSFASVASICTIIRIPYIKHNRNPKDNLLYYTGFIVLLSNTETAIGCVASSIPAFRHLLRRQKPKNASSSALHGTHDAAAQGSGGRQNSKVRVFCHPTDIGMTLASVRAHGDEEWTRLNGPDSDHSSDLSTGGVIRSDYTYQVELSKLPQPSQSESTRELVRDRSLC